MATLETHRTRKVSRWRWLTVGAGAFLVLVSALVAVWWALSRETRTTTYEVRGQLEAITLDLGSADATVVGAGGRSSVGVRYVDRFAFDRPAETSRSVRDGELHIRSRCPDAMLSPCTTGFRVTVPDNVPLTVLTSSGSVRFDGFRGSARVQTGSGDVSIERYCGFALSARADTGDVSAGAACAFERLELRSRTGDVRALVPAGRYRVDADTDTGVRRLRGVTAVDDSPFQVLAISDTGDVTVEATP